MADQSTPSEPSENPRSAADLEDFVSAPSDASGAQNSLISDNDAARQAAEILREAGMVTADEASSMGFESANTAESIAAAVAGATEPITAANMDSASLEQLLQQASFEDPSGGSPPLPGAEGEPFKLPSFQQVIQDAQVSSIELLRDVELNVKIELGRSKMLVEDVLKLAEGSVVELDKLAGDPVDVFVNDRLVARGEVLVLNDNFCVRVNEIVAGAKEEV